MKMVRKKTTADGCYYQKILLLIVFGRVLPFIKTCYSTEKKERGVYTAFHAPRTAGTGQATVETAGGGVHFLLNRNSI